MNLPQLEEWISDFLEAFPDFVDFSDQGESFLAHEEYKRDILKDWVKRRGQT